MKLALVQANPTLGDFVGNIKIICDFIRVARLNKVDLLIFPELMITGYPPEDMVFLPDFIESNRRALQSIVSETSDITVVVGFIDESNGDLFNAAAIISDTKEVGIYHKISLPNYGVFDEKRYFHSGENKLIFSLDNFNLGLTICEDIWDEGPLLKDYKKKGVDIVLNISASPFHIGKQEERYTLLTKRARDNDVCIAYSNMVGGQDELVYDGNSMFIDSNGNLATKAASFAEQLICVEFNKVLDNIKVIEVSNIDRNNSSINTKNNQTNYELERDVYQALVLGTKDYVLKNGFTKVLVALSGGIDSSLVASVAVDAIGKDNVVGVAMPSQYSSVSSLEDASSLSTNLGIDLWRIPIKETYYEFLNTLGDHLNNDSITIAHENLQARIRGVVMMTLSNYLGWLVLTTGNKSEFAVGYGTLYGDMAGGYSIIKDVYKSLVYRLAEFRNFKEEKIIIPVSILEKPPSAELRPNQKDLDSLPPYSILDPILELYIESNFTIDQILKQGFEKKTVLHVLNLVDKSEYKRRQAPPGIKISGRNFGRDRRMPIINKYSHLDKQ